MATCTIDGTTIAYELIGDGQPFVLTPGGRFSMDAPGVRELALELAAHGKQVLIWDRPNTGGFRRLLPGAVGVGDAGRRAGRSAARHWTWRPR